MIIKTIETNKKTYKINMHGVVIECKGYTVCFEGSLEGIPFFLSNLSEEKYDSSKNYVLCHAINGEIAWILKTKIEDSIELIEYIDKGIEKNLVTRVNNIINSGAFFPEYNELLNKKMTIINKKFNVLLGRGERELINVFKEIPLNLYFNNIVFCKPIGIPSRDTLYIGCPIILHKPKYINREYINDVESNLPYFIPEVRYIGNTEYRIDIMSHNYEQPLAYYYPKTNIMLICNFLYSNYIWLENVVEVLKLKKKFIPQKLAITLGCDPEFELKFCDKIIIPPCELMGSSRLRSKIGTDGHGSQIEIRTCPSENEADIVEDMRKSFEKISYLDMSAESKKEPCGGHIHVGGKIQGIISILPLTDEIKNLFDIFIGKNFLDIKSEVRSLGGWGKLGDFRQQPWGFEYRTLPSACFQNPKIVKIILKIAKSLCLKYYSKIPISFHRITEYEDYKNLCGLSLKEYNYFINFSKSFDRNKKRNVIKFWCKSTLKSKFTVEFHDMWDQEAMDWFKFYLSDLVTPFHVKIILYGLKNDVSISGIYDGRYQLVNHPKDIKHLKNGICFGMPKNYRINASESYIMQVCKVIRLKMNRIFEPSLSEEDCNTYNLFPEEIYGFTSKVPKFTEIQDCATPNLLGIRMPINFMNTVANEREPF